MKTICAVVVACMSATLGCGGTPPPPAASPPGSPPPTTFAEQVSVGQKLYGDRCAKCHGAGGEGAKGPRVVGLKDGALPMDPPASAKYRKGQFKTVSDVADFVVKSMPPNAPGSLKADEYWAILAFDLKANGIDLGAKTLDAPLAATLTIPR